MRVRVAVPASVANLGPGFDILALALQLQNDIRAEQVDGDDLTIDPGPGAPDEFRDPSRNLVSRAYVYASEVVLGVQAGGVHFSCVNRIPIGRGLGSSAAAVLAGVLTASAFHRAPWDENDVLNARRSPRRPSGQRRRGTPWRSRDLLSRRAGRATGGCGCIARRPLCPRYRV